MALIHGDHRLVSMVLMGSDTCEFAETLGYDGHGIGHGGYSEIMLPTSSNDFRMDKTMCFTIQGDRDTEKITDFFFSYSTADSSETEMETSCDLSYNLECY